MKKSIGVAVTVLCCFALTGYGQQEKAQLVDYSIEEQRAYGLAGADGTPAQLRHYFAEGSVTVGDTKMQVVGGILLDGKPVLWVNTKELSLGRRLVSTAKGAFPPSPSKNKCIGVLSGFSTTGVTFSEALFMSPAPSEGNARHQDVSLFFWYLSPLSGAT